MKKSMCDLCSGDAPDRPGIEYSEPWGITWKTSIEVHQAALRVSIIFSFVQRADGFAGPPDLCKSCQVQLLQKIIAGGLACH